METSKSRKNRRTGKKKKKEMHDCQQDRLGSKEELTHENINNGKGK